MTKLRAEFPNFVQNLGTREYLTVTDEQYGSSIQFYSR